MPAAKLPFLTIMVVTVMVTLLFLMPIFQYTPNVILGAIIVTAFIGLIDIPAAFEIWKIDKFDFLVMLCAFFGVLFISVEQGLAIAVGLSIFKILMQITRPKTMMLGNIPGTNIYRDLHHYKEAVSVPGFLIALKLLSILPTQLTLKKAVSALDTNGVSFFKDLRMALNKKNLEEKAPCELSTPERIEAAVRRKEEGNQLFKIGKYQRAAKKYEKAVDYVSQDVPYTDDDEKIVKPLMLSCWSNGAACCLKLNNFREAIDLCSKILNAESCNVKALYRRAQAYTGVAELLLAELDIKKALEVDPQNREVWLMQKNLKQLQAQNNKQDAKLYRAMFSSKSEDACIAEKEGDENLCL